VGGYNFAMFENNYNKTLALANTVFTLLASLALKLHPTKGHFLPILVGEHLGMILDFEKGEFRASTVKLNGIATLAKGSATPTNSTPSSEVRILR
jgi:hypothetical protein